MKKISFHCNSGHQLFFRLTNQIFANCSSATKTELKSGSNYYSLYLYMRLEKEKNPIYCVSLTKTRLLKHM